MLSYKIGNGLYLVEDEERGNFLVISKEVDKIG